MSPVLNQPSLVKTLLRFFRLVVIPAHHVWTTHFDLAIFRDSYVNVRNRLADSAHTIVFDLARRYDRRSLSQPVTLHDRNARTDVDVRQILRQRRASRHQNSHPSAKSSFPLRKHQLRRDRVFEA